AAPKNYISVYPFVKTTEWYLLPFERRRALMEEHGLVGRKYAVARESLARESLAPAAAANGSGHRHRTPRTARTAVAQEFALAAGGGVLANTVDAYGLGDYEFILATESDD